MVRFSWTIKNSDGTRATGKTPKITIQRDSDDYYWNGISFQLIEIDNGMTEQAKGVYYFDYTGDIQDLFVYYDESTIPRYSEAYYSVYDLADRIDGLDRKVTNIVYNGVGNISTCSWQFSAIGGFGSPLITFNLTYTYDVNDKLTNVEIVKA